VSVFEFTEKKKADLRGFGGKLPDIPFQEFLFFLIIIFFFCPTFFFQVFIFFRFCI